jgi:thioesterase domain-containing protein
MAAHYIAEMRQVQTRGPYYIGGHCAGAWPAYEVARQLRAAGEQVAGLVLVDVEPPGVQPPRPHRLRSVMSRLRYYVGEGRLVDALVWDAKLLYQRVIVRRLGAGDQQRVADLRRTHAEAHRRYQGGRYDGDVLLLRSEQSAGFPDRDWHLRWAELIDGTLDVGIVPGAHSALVEEESSAAIARFILGLTRSG